MSRERVDISLPPAGKLAIAGAGLLLVVMVVLLAATLAVLSDSREHIAAQDRKVNRIVKGAGPVLDQVEPVAGDARELLAQATPFVRDLRAAMVPVLRDFRDGAFVPRVLVAADLVPVMERILAETLDVQRATLATQRETLGTQRETLGTQRETLGTQRVTLAIQRESRDLQRQTLAILQRSLAVQEEALAHVRSIDRKTGGPAPTAAPAPVPGPR